MFFKKIEAGLSSVLYHWTVPANAVQILKEDKFRLKQPQHYDNPNYNYLSTSRAKFGGYHINRPGVIFVLDGNALSKKYKGDAIDYYHSNSADRFYVTKEELDEMEDRILSKKEAIENAHIYIKEIHVCLRTSDRHGESLSDAAQNRGIPIFFYNLGNMLSWLNLNKKRASTTPIVPEKLAANVESLASKQVGKLYLFISPDKLSLATTSGRMKPLVGTQPMDIRKKSLHYKNEKGDSIFYGVSTTRNPNWKPNETAHHGYWDVIRLTLDGDKISTKYPVKSYNDFWKSDDYAKRKRSSEDEFYAQSEEKIITDKYGFKDWMKYLLAVDVLEEAKDEFIALKLDFKNIPVSFVKDFSNAFKFKQRVKDKYSVQSSVIRYDV
jgi:hypothetical protein